ncbi:MAG: hypothetical protein ABI833_11620 [Acidobacteriota bacterium]
MAFTIDARCPRCTSEMEAIETDIVDVPLDDLRLCPNCYLVTWNDQRGHHTQQGVPVQGTTKKRALA